MRTGTRARARTGLILRRSTTPATARAQKAIADISNALVGNPYAVRPR